MRRLVSKTSRLIIRPLRSTDHAAWFDAYVHSLPARNAWDKKPLTAHRCRRTEFEKVRARHAKRAKEDKCYIYAVFLKGEKKLVGFIDFFVYERGQLQYANFGYQIFNRYWGRGYGKESTKAGLKIGFEQLKLHRLEAGIHPRNVRSLRLARALGMRREGVRRRFWREKNGWEDDVVFAATPEDLLH